MKVKKKFMYNGVQILIVEREEPLTKERTWKPLRVIAPNGGVIPLPIEGKQSLKSIEAKTVEVLDGFKARGADVHEILTKEIN